MQRPRQHPLRTTAALAALRFAILATIARLAQLAFAATAATPVATCEPTQAPCDLRSADRELAQLYAACPMARVIALKPVEASPQTASALLPAYRETAERVRRQQPLEAAMPRIRYPGSLQQPPSQAWPHETVRVAEAAPLAGSGESQWLIDPKDWFEAGEDPKHETAKVSPQAGPKPEPAAATPQPQVPAPAAPAPREAHEAVAPLPRPAEPPAAVSPAPPAATPIPLFAPPPNAPVSESAAAVTRPAVDPHLELFAKDAYPAARDCAKCHEEIYNDWSISAHAYAAVSPMFNKFEQKLNDLSQGTMGYFCMRCHAPVATAMCASRAEPLWNLPESAREGITCIACHRVQYVYGKSNGERRIEPGNIFAPVLGGMGGDGVAEAVHHKEKYKVKTSPGEQGPGQEMHAQGVYFEPLTRSEFCTPCHQVAVHPGIKLEVVWEQYRASPACKKGIQCQDCHMGRVPGLPLGYDCGPVAKIADKTVNDSRKKSNHIFYGPNYPIAHPGVFPFNLKANRWTMDQWLAFDWRAGWGTKDFEKAVADGQVQVAFPPAWADADDRCDAREIIDDNLKKINRKRDIRLQVMQNGSHVEGPFFDSPLCRGQDLRFHFLVTNTNGGHNLLTASLGAQPQLWVNIVLIGPDGKRLWETGYTDSNGDLANIHSIDVREKRLPYDWQLFNLQTMFLVQGAVGTDREFYVPVNFDADQLPFVRPGVQPITILNHPPTIRMESQSLAPLGARRVPYRVAGNLLQQPGTYRISFRMRSRAEPAYLMRFCDATQEMLRAESEGMIDLHPTTVEFVVH